MSKVEKRHFDAAGEMVDLFAAKLGRRRAVHSETAIAAGARMAGTMLLRSFGFNTSAMSPGSVVLSDEANVQGPELVNIVAAMLHNYGLPLDPGKGPKITSRGEEPQLGVTEMQKL